MSKLMDDVVTTARNFAQNIQQHFDTPLDYSLSSLADIDDMLDGLSKRLDDLKEDAFFDLYTMTGCYVFEVARRSYGGEYFWIQEERQPVLVAGLPEFFVGIKAWEKVRGRLTNGEEDNIPFYIQGYEEHIAIGRTKKGYHVTIV